MSIIEFLSQPIWQRLGVTLLHFLWQGFALAMLVPALIHLLRLKPGTSRYAAYFLAFIAMTACPIITFFAIDTSLPRAQNVPPPLATAPDVEAEIEPESAFSETPGANPAAPIEPPLLNSIPPAVSSLPRPTDSRAMSLKTAGSLRALLPWAMVMWLLGVTALSGRLLLGFIGMRRWRRRLEALPEELTRRVACLSERFGLRRAVEVFASPLAMEPLAVGYLRPMVLLPTAMLTGTPTEVLEAVIAHELAHIRRLDLWCNLLQRVVETLLFYHPAVWWLSGRLRRERELCCDETAVRATGQRLAYASALERLARARIAPRRPALAMGLGQGRQLVLARVHHVLGMAPARQHSGHWFAGILTITVILGLGAFSFVRLAHAEVRDQPAGVATHDVVEKESTEKPNANELTVKTPSSIQCDLTWCERVPGEAPLTRALDLRTSKIVPRELAALETKHGRYGRLHLKAFPEQLYAYGFNQTSFEDLAFFIDINRDGEVTDDETFRVTAHKNGQISNWRVGPIDIPVQDGPATRKHKVSFVIVGVRPSVVRFDYRPYMVAAGAMSGRMRLAEHDLLVRLVDYNCDGRYDTASADPNECDLACFDLNADGAIQHDEKFHVGSHLSYGGRFYQIHATRDGRQVSLTPVDVPCGQLRAPGITGSMVLRGEAAPIRIAVVNGAAIVPAGKYTVESHMTNVKTPAGSIWRISGPGGASSPLGERRLEVLKDRTTEVRIGPPLQGKLVINPTKNGIRFHWSVHDAGGQVSVTAPGGTCPVPPTITIKDSAEEVVHRGTMKGGCGGKASYLWRPANELTAPVRFSATAVCDQWPVGARPADAKAEYVNPEPGPGSRITARPLTARERSLLPTVIDLACAAEERFDKRPQAFLCEVDSQLHTTIWEYKHLRRFGSWAGEEEVAYGDSRRDVAEAEYYLPDGTPLVSRLRVNDEGMHEVAVNVGRVVKPGERITVISRRSRGGFRLMHDQNSRTKCLVFNDIPYRRPRAMVVRLAAPLRRLQASPQPMDPPLDYGPQEMTWLISPTDKREPVMVWFETPDEG